MKIDISTREEYGHDRDQIPRHFLLWDKICRPKCDNT